MTDPNAEALRIVRLALMGQARQALAHLLNNALAPVVMEADLDGDEDMQQAVSNLRRVVREVTR